MSASTKRGLSGSEARFAMVEPWPQPVEGADLLDALCSWFIRYAVFLEGAPEAITVWDVATWFRDEVYFAPILALLSPTKGSGKTTVLDLLRRIVSRPHFTSGFGATPATIFRLNHEQHPTFLIDEAERLKSDRDLITLLNDGYRKGARVSRCVGDGDYKVRTYDAFGFRAVASIGRLWDTITDRSIVIPMLKKPRDAEVARFNAATDKEGNDLSRKIRRWTDDNRKRFRKALEEVERPQWLEDRECDNWAALFAIAQLAGGDWPDRIRSSARRLARRPGEDGDPGERLILDVHDVFRSRGYPEAMKSGDLASKLAEIETSPWGEERGGKGISAYNLAKRLKPFGISPRQARADGDKLRGYWLEDLRPVFECYLPHAEVGQLGQPSNDADSGCPTSNTKVGQEWDGETPHEQRNVPLVPHSPSGPLKKPQKAGRA